MQAAPGVTSHHNLDLLIPATENEKEPVTANVCQLTEEERKQQAEATRKQFFEGAASGIVRSPTIAFPSLSAEEMKKVEAYVGALADQVATNPNIVRAFLASPEIVQQVQKNIDNAVKEMTDEQHALFTHLATRFSPKITEFIKSFALLNDQMPPLLKALLANASTDVVRFAIQSVLVPTIKQNCEDIGKISPQFLKNLVDAQKKEKSAIQLVEIPEALKNEITLFQGELVASVIRNSQMETGIKQFLASDQALEKLQMNIGLAESELTVDELAFSDNLSDMAFAAIKPLLQWTSVPAASDEAVYFGIKNVFFEGGAGYIKTACAKICSIHPGYVKNLIVLKGLKAEKVESKPVEGSQEPLAKITSFVKSVYEELKNNPMLLMVAICAETAPEMVQVQMAKTEVAGFLLKATAEQKAVFTYLTSAIQAQHTPLLEQLCRLTPDRPKVTPEAAKLAIQGLLVNKIPDATSQIGKVAPEFLQNLVLTQEQAPYIAKQAELTKKLEFVPHGVLKELQTMLLSEDVKNLESFFRVHAVTEPLSQLDQFLKELPSKIQGSIFKGFAEAINEIIKK